MKTRRAKVQDCLCLNPRTELVRVGLVKLGGHEGDHCAWRRWGQAHPQRSSKLRWDATTKIAGLLPVILDAHHDRLWCQFRFQYLSF